MNTFKFTKLVSSALIAAFAIAVLTPMPVYAVDTEPPSVDIWAPADGYETDQASIWVWGFVQDDVSTITTVTIDGMEVLVDYYGYFYATVPLVEGSNEITITAVDEASNVGTAMVTVSRVVYRLTGSTDIEFDMRRDGRCYFDVDAELQAPWRIAPLATVPLWVVGAVAAPAIPEEVALPLAAGVAVPIAVAIYYVTAVPEISPLGSTSLAALGSPLSSSPVQVFPLDGDVSLEVASPEPGAFKFTADGWVTIPADAMSQVQMLVGAYNAAPEAANLQLLQMGREEIDKIREQLSPEFADLELKELEITSLSLQNSKLSFSMTATLSCQMFKKEELLKEIEESGLNEKMIQQQKAQVEELFESLPIKTRIAFEVSAEDEEAVSLVADVELFMHEEKSGELNITFEYSKIEKFLTFELHGKTYEEGEVLYRFDTTFDARSTLEGFRADFDARAYKEEELLGTVTLTLTFSEIEESLTFELHGKSYEEGEVFYKVDVTFDASKENGTLSFDFDSPRGYCTSEISYVGENFTIETNGWFELPMVDNQVRWKAYTIEDLLPKLAEYGNVPLAELEEGLAELENELREVLENLNATLTLKVPPDAELVGLPTGYQLVDSIYEWSGAAANDALVHLLMGRLREITYSAALIPTSLSISPSSFTIQPEQSITLTATLTSDGSPLDGKLITWTAMAGSVSPDNETTNAQGKVSATYTAPDIETTVTVTASFAGDDQYAASSGSSQSTITTLPTTTLMISPASFMIQPENSMTLTAVLTSDGTPLADKLITWSATAGAVSPSSAVTDSQGQVSTTYTAPYIETTVTVTASFAGDENYLGSSGSSSGIIEAAPLELTLAVKFIPAGENHVFKFEDYPVPIFKVTITAEDNVEDAEVTVEMVENVEVPVPPGIVHRYMKIETNIAPASIKGLLTKFRVSKSWVVQNDIDEETIRVLKFDEVENEWRALPTEPVGTDENYLYFKVTMSEFSLFAITGEKAAPTPILLIILAVIAASAGGVGIVAALWVRSKRRSRLKRARYIAKRRKKGKRRAT